MYVNTHTYTYCTYAYWLKVKLVPCFVFAMFKDSRSSFVCGNEFILFYLYMYVQYTYTYTCIWTFCIQIHLSARLGRLHTLIIAHTHRYAHTYACMYMYMHMHAHTCFTCFNAFLVDVCMYVFLLLNNDDFRSRNYSQDSHALCIHSYICTYICINKISCIHINIIICICIFIYICIFILLVWVYVSKYICLYECTYMYVYVSTGVSLYVCMYALTLTKYNDQNMRIKFDLKCFYSLITLKCIHTHMYVWVYVFRYIGDICMYVCI